MKILLTFKTPDVLWQALKDCCYNEEDRAEAERVCSKFVKYGEYIRIEVDTDTGTAKVLEA